MVNAPVTRRAERTVDGVRISSWGARAVNMRTVPDTRLETRYREEPRIIQEPVHTHHEEYRDGRWERTHTTTSYEDKEIWETESYTVAVPWNRPVFDVAGDDGWVMREMDVGKDAVGDGDTIIILDYYQISSGAKWSAWINASNRMWLHTGKPRFPLSEAVRRAATEMRDEMERGAREVLRNRRPTMRPYHIEANHYAAEGVVRSAQGTLAVVDFIEFGTQDVLMHPSYRIAPGDLMQVVARIHAGVMLPPLTMSNPVTWTRRENTAAIEAVRKTRSPRRQYQLAGAGLAGLAAAFAGAALGWPAMIWGVLGLAGIGAGMKAAKDRLRDDAMDALEKREIATLNNIVDRGYSIFAGWNWRRIRDGF